MNEAEKQAIEAALLNINNCRAFLQSIAGTDNVLLSDFVLDMLEATTPIQRKLSRLNKI